MSHVELSHNPNQEFSIDYAYLINKEGTIERKLKKKDLLTRNDLSYQAFYQDDLITEFELYSNQYPYRIEYSYSVIEKEYLYVAWWTPLVFNDVKTVRSSLEINLPSDYDINISMSENIAFKESEQEGKRTLSWTSHDIARRLKNEIYSPEIERLIPTVKVIPKKFTYGVSGKADSWSSFGNWLDQLNENTDELTVREDSIISQLISDLDDQREITKVIYHYLQDQTKYVNVAIEVGGLKSYPASYVCDNKYGDCKALTTYMKAMLKSVGIESFYTAIKAGNNSKIDDSFPSQQFNHVILMIPLKNDTVWLENTSNSLPFNYLGTFTQNRFALVTNKENSQLVKTPQLTEQDVLIERKYGISLSADGKVHVNLNACMRGNEFEEFRFLLSEKDIEGQRRKIAKHHDIQGFEISKSNINDFHRDSTYLEIQLNGVSYSFVRNIGEFRVINPLRISIPDFEKPTERKLDVVVGFPINKHDKSVYDLGKAIENEVQIPESITIQSRYGSYFSKYSVIDNKLTVVEKFTLLANTIALKDYEDFYSFIDSINAYKKKTAILIK